ncbi:NHL repeat-containing protein [Leptospira semungkisensis]|nr:NHL repeat-containing protein [Leptospira semungkisensis]
MCDRSSDSYWKFTLLAQILGNDTSPCNGIASECGTLKTGENASLVLGQSDFVSSASGSGLNQLYDPRGVAHDYKGGVWVGDSGNARVLHFSPPLTNGMSPDIVLTAGMSGVSFVTGEPQGGVWVGDQNNHRVIHFPNGVATGGTFDIMLGTGSAGITSNKLYYPMQGAIDLAGGVWVSDYMNYRVLHFSPPLTNSMSADIVIGQTDFITRTLGLAQNKLNYPQGITVDKNNHLWVADSSNQRVLRFSSPFSNGMNADVVLGAPDFTSTGSGTTQDDSFGGPSGVSTDLNGGVWVGDNGNSRALHFSSPFSNGMNADKVLGEPDFVSTNASNIVSAAYVRNPMGLSFSPCNGLWLTDQLSNRVLLFP